MWVVVLKATGRGQYLHPRGNRGRIYETVHGPYYLQRDAEEFAEAHNSANREGVYAKIYECSEVEPTAVLEGVRSIFADR